MTTFRRPAGIGYPKAFADSSDMSAADPEKKKAMYLFNCAQRAHGNYLENYSTFAVASLIAGLQYPLVTTGLSVVWQVSRILYAVGYTRKDRDDGKGRLIGNGFWFAQLGLWGLSAWSGIKMVL